MRVQVRRRAAAECRGCRSSRTPSCPCRRSGTCSRRVAPGVHVGVPASRCLPRPGRPSSPGHTRIIVSSLQRDGRAGDHEGETGKRAARRRSFIGGSLCRDRRARVTQLEAAPAEHVAPRDSIAYSQRKMRRMSLSRARLRYLSAMGAVVPSLALAACKDPAPPPHARTARGDDPLASASGRADHFRQFHMPSCPNGAFCVAESDEGRRRRGGTRALCEVRRDGHAPRRRGRLGTQAAFARSRSTPRTPRSSAQEGAAACCYTWVTPCPGGRAFRDATGTPSVARTIDRADWSAAIAALATAHLAVESEPRSWITGRAKRRSSTRRSRPSRSSRSICSRSARRRSSSRRPARDARRDRARAHRLRARDRLRRRPVGPAALAALPGASRTLAAIARITFIDACVGESVASAALAEASRAGRDPVLRDLLATMARTRSVTPSSPGASSPGRCAPAAPRSFRSSPRRRTRSSTELLSLTHDVAASSEETALRAMVLREVVLPCTVALLGSMGHLTAGRQHGVVCRPRCPRTESCPRSPDARRA